MLENDLLNFGVKKITKLQRKYDPLPYGPLAALAQRVIFSSAIWQFFFLPKFSRSFSLPKFSNIGTSSSFGPDQKLPFWIFVKMMNFF